MHDDQELRTQLLRDRADRGRQQGADQLLSELRPAMRRARRLRIAATTAAITVGLTGLAGAAQLVRIDRNDTYRVASDNSLTDLEPIATVDHGDDDHPDSSATVPAASFDDPKVDDPITSAPATHHDDVEPPPVDSRPTTASDVGEQPTPTPTITSATATTAATTPSATTAPAATATAGPPAMPTTTAATTTTDAQPQPERFDSACGWVLALRSSNSVELIEIHPEPGYDARPEDPDHGNVTVQFTGPGDDCELKITTTDSPQHDG